MSERQVLACIDDSPHALAVCAAAAWAADRIGAPLELMHVLGKATSFGPADASGQIGLGSREHLREQLTTLDEQRAKLAQQSGRELLEAAKAQAERSIPNTAISVALRHGDLVESLAEREAQARLVVLGKRGESADEAQEHLGSNLERVVRALHTPILVTPRDFQVPSRLLLAFDGSRTTRKGVETIADSPLLNGLVCHVVMVGAGTDDQRAQLEWALNRLREGHVQAEGEILAGEVDEVLADYTAQRQIDLMIMGAYGHSRIRHLLVGSTTTAMLRQSRTATLILR